jgi:hypothetical protein
VAHRLVKMTQQPLDFTQIDETVGLAVAVAVLAAQGQGLPVEAGRLLVPTQLLVDHAEIRERACLTGPVTGLAVQG